MEFLINITVIFSLTTLLILTIKSAFGNKLSPKWHVMIWIILLVRLAFPILPESQLSVFNLVPDLPEKHIEYFQDSVGEDIQNKNNTKEILVFDKENGRKFSAINSDRDVKDSLTSVESFQSKINEEEGKRINDIDKYFLIIYCLGICIMAAGLFISYLKIMSIIKELPECKDAKVLEIFTSCKEKAGVGNRRITLKQGNKTPMLVGIFNPTIYISEFYNAEELKHVFIHELCHYKKKDNIWNAVASMILCFNWFNPLAWYAFKKFKHDLEMYCDYNAINIIEDKKAYAEVLLKTSTGKNSFMFATTCLENGEKQVSHRIKRIAYFKKPKLWVSSLGIILVLLLGVFCLTNEVKDSNKIQLISLNGPNGIYSEYMMKVPLSWGKDYKEFIPEEPPYYGNVTFHDKEGNEIAGLTYSLIDFSEIQDESKEEMGMKDLVDYQGKVKELVKKSKYYLEITNSPKGNIIIEELKANSEYIKDIYKVSYLRSSKIERTELYIIHSEVGTNIPILYKEGNAIKDEELVKAATSLEPVKKPTDYKPTTQAEWFTDTKIGVSVMGGKYDARGLLEDYFDNYVNTEMPPSIDIKGYKINKFEEIGPLGDVAGIIDEGMIQNENAPWDIIYPTAKVYKMDYELIPKDYERFNDLAGGGFQVTESGNKHYTERYGVFYGYTVDGEDYRGTFLGFLIDGTLAEWGVDYSTLNLIDSFYETEILNQILDKGRVEYIGDASAVGKLRGLLPLHEYGNGLELQTKMQPYGGIFNYKIGRADLYNSETGGILVSWPKENSKITEIYSKVLPGELNYYIKKQLQKNAKYLTMGIENSYSTEINCESPYLQKKYSTVYSENNE